MLDQPKKKTKVKQMIPNGRSVHSPVLIREASSSKIYVSNEHHLKDNLAYTELIDKKNSELFFHLLVCRSLQKRTQQNNRILQQQEVCICWNFWMLDIELIVTRSGFSWGLAAWVWPWFPLPLPLPKVSFLSALTELCLRILKFLLLS